MTQSTFWIFIFNSIPSIINSSYRIKLCSPRSFQNFERRIAKYLRRNFCLNFWAIRSFSLLHDYVKVQRGVLVSFVDIFSFHNRIICKNSDRNFLWFSCTETGAEMFLNLDLFKGPACIRVIYIRLWKNISSLYSAWFARKLYFHGTDLMPASLWF